MTYLDPVNSGDKKVKAPKPIKMPKEKKPEDKKPVFKSKRAMYITIAAIVVVVIAVIVGVLFAVNTANTNNARDKQVAAAEAKKEARSTLVADVQKTTANIKAYLKKNPNATIDEMIANSNTVNKRLDEGESILIANAANTPEKAYTNWIVVGTDPALNKDSNYQYQSFSNTFRWMNNKTGASSDIVEDKAARNTGALGAPTK